MSTSRSDAYFALSMRAFSNYSTLAEMVLSEEEEEDSCKLVNSCHMPLT